MKLVILTAWLIKEKYLQEACAEYIKRLSAMEPVEIIRVAASPIADENSPASVIKALEKESARILCLLKPDDFVIALTPDGQSMDSQSFSVLLSAAVRNESITAVSNSSAYASLLSAFVEKMRLGQYKRLAFVIGSSHGLAPAIYDRSAFRLSLSAMTFPHQFALIMLLEQIYRGQMIHFNRAYHK